MEWTKSDLRQCNATFLPQLWVIIGFKVTCLSPAWELSTIKYALWKFFLLLRSVLKWARKSSFNVLIVIEAYASYVFEQNISLSETDASISPKKSSRKNEIANGNFSKLMPHCVCNACIRWPAFSDSLLFPFVHFSSSKKDFPMLF